MNAPDDRDEKLLHRLEAFSDIVIGFSLAQATLSLEPKKFFIEPTYVMAFAVTFAGVASIWWIHNRLFAKFFVPNRLSIFLNFIALGCIILYVFSLQAMMTAASKAAIPFYFATFGMVYLLLGALYLLGVRERRPVLSVEDYRHGLGRGVRTSLVGVAMLMTAGEVYLYGFHPQTLKFVLAPIIIALLAMRVLEFAIPILRKPKRV